MPEAGGHTYRANEAIEVAFTFDTRVVVEGDACVTLYLGYDGHNSEGTARQAHYLRGSGTDTLVFGYTVRPDPTTSTDPRSRARTLSPASLGESHGTGAGAASLRAAVLDSRYGVSTLV